jgi:hypothetical protein
VSDSQPVSHEDAMNTIAGAVRALPESEHGISNFDHAIDPGLEADLRAGMRGSHAAWEFHGTVWFDAKAGQFCEAVRRYRALIGIVGRPTLEELMVAVNDEYGWD